LADQGHQLLLRRVSDNTQLSVWVAEFENWHQRTLDFLEKYLPKAEGMQFRTIGYDPNLVPRAFDEVHQDKLQFLSARVGKLRLMADRWAA
jgi:hypothetical protein